MLYEVITKIDLARERHAHCPLHALEDLRRLRLPGLHQTFVLAKPIHKYRCHAGGTGVGARELSVHLAQIATRPEAPFEALGRATCRLEGKPFTEDEVPGRITSYNVCYTKLLRNPHRARRNGAR